jgi:hypothetical protein
VSPQTSGTMSQILDGRLRATDGTASEQTVPDKHRDILSLFIGSVKTSQDSSRLLRRKLYAQCTEAGPICQWHTTAHSCTGVVNASNSMLLFKRAQYCPAPAGMYCNPLYVASVQMLSIFTVSAVVTSNGSGRRQLLDTRSATSC